MTAGPSTAAAGGAVQVPLRRVHNKPAGSLVAVYRLLPQGGSRDKWMQEQHPETHPTNHAVRQDAKYGGYRSRTNRTSTALL